MFASHMHKMAERVKVPLDEVFITCTLITCTLDYYSEVVEIYNFRKN